MFYSTVTALALLGLGVNGQDVQTAPKAVDPLITSGKAVGSNMPTVGFGTWMLPNNDKGAEAVARAMKLGYRHFDGATAYTNQQAVGKGLALGLKNNPHIKREELWITSKIWATRHKDVTGGIDINLKQLGLDYIDLMLVHFPVIFQGNSQQPKKDDHGAPIANATVTVAEYDYLPMWAAMEAALSAGKIKHIGISNFNVTQIDDLLAHAKVKPYVHQIEAHPYLQDWKFYDYHTSKGLRLAAYAPLGNTNPEYHYRNWKSAGKAMLSDPTLSAIATARGCSTAQVALAWNLARNVTTVVKAQNAQHAIENYEARQTCKLTSEDLAKIKALDQDGKGGKRYWDMCCAMDLPCYHGLQDGPVGPAAADYCEDPWKNIKYNKERTDLWLTKRPACNALF
ncbi:hypothetical protein BT63DRAFT_396328 [Microthyrium microscopicum]|uniref:NADP-dependent oxidoreductase domain-containing protein n=1 Tax=Microthyrium microscopicum TaxID=703497 RepID=A0A6A6UNZ0_9PEZI|nr:hypothetical protein BT63DRAFT_396328 [Microthyrium microscopicum]